MSSIITEKKPRKPRTLKLSKPGPNLSKKVLLNITSLSNYKSEKPFNQLMIKVVQDMYKTRNITNFKTANTALNLLTSGNDFNKFKTLYTKITQQTIKKTETTKIKKEIKQQKTDTLIKDKITKIEKVYNTPDKVHKNKESEMPSYEVIIKQKYITDFSIICNICKIPLYKHARAYMDEKQKPVKVVVGCHFTIFKKMPDGDMNFSFLNDDEEANEGYRGNYIFRDLIVSTKNKSVYTSDTMKETVLSLEAELNNKITKAIDEAGGSGWAIYQFNKCIVCYVRTKHPGRFIYQTTRNLII